MAPRKHGLRRLTAYDLAGIGERYYNEESSNSPQHKDIGQLLEHTAVVSEHLNECEALLRKIGMTVAEGPYPDNPVWNEIAAGIAALLGPAPQKDT